MVVDFQIIVEDAGGHPLLKVEGRLDAASAPALETKLEESLSKGHKKILIDFEKVEYLSSAAMRLLLSLSKKLKGEGGDLVLFSMNDDVTEIVKLAGFEKILTIYPNRKDAVAAA